MNSIDFNLDHYPTLKAASLSDAIIRTVRGPAGSAKTTWAFIELLRRSCQQAPGSDGVRRTKWLVGRNTYQVLISATLETARRTLGPAFKVRESIPPTITGAFALDDGSRVETEFEFLSLEGDDAFQKLLGFESTGGFLDEISELPEAVVHAVMRRLGRFPSGQYGTPTWTGLIGVTNGPIEGHWLHRWELGENRELLLKLAAESGLGRPYFHAFAQPPALLRPTGFTTTRRAPAFNSIPDSDEPLPASDWLPNPRAENVVNLPGGYGYYFSMLADPDDAKIIAFVEGQFAPLKKGKLVFPGFRRDRHVVAMDDLHLPDGIELGLSFDFGRTPVCGVWVMTASGRLVQIEEVMADGSSIEGLVRSHLRPLLAKRYRISRIGWATGDPSGADGRDNVDMTPYQVLWDLGIPIETPGSNRLEPRLEAVNARLSRIEHGGHPMVQIRENCTFTIESLARNYIYEQVSVVHDIVRDKPTKSHVNWVSDLADQVQYACLYHPLSFARQRERAPLPDLPRRWA